MNRLRGITECRYGYNIKLDPNELGHDDLNWIYLAFENAVMDL